VKKKTNFLSFSKSKERMRWMPDVCVCVHVCINQAYERYSFEYAKRGWVNINSCRFSSYSSFALKTHPLCLVFVLLSRTTKTDTFRIMCVCIDAYAVYTWKSGKRFFRKLLRLYPLSPSHYIHTRKVERWERMREERVKRREIAL